MARTAQLGREPSASESGVRRRVDGLRSVSGGPVQAPPGFATRIACVSRELFAFTRLNACLLPFLFLRSAGEPLAKGLVAMEEQDGHRVLEGCAEGHDQVWPAVLVEISRSDGFRPGRGSDPVLILECQSPGA